MADEGSIEFDVTLDAKDAERTLASVKRKILQLQNELKVKEGRRGELEKSLEDASNAADAARDRLKKLRAEQERLTAVVKANANGKPLPDMSYEEFMRAKPRLEELKSEIKEQEAYEKQLTKEAEAAWAAMEKYNGEVAALNDKLNTQKGIYGDIATQARAMPPSPAPAAPSGGGGGARDTAASLSGASRIAAASLSGASRIAAALNKRTRSFASQWKRVHSYLANSVGRLRIFSTLTAGIGKTLRRIAGLAGGAFIFSAISQNFRSLRSSMEEMLQTNTNLMMALTRFKGALKAAFLPIYQVAVPALTQLLNLLTRIMNTVAAFTAALTGKSAKEIKATAAAIDAQAEATEDEGKAAKDASKPLASFDEINKLESKDAGGAGGTGADIEDVEFPDIDVKSWGEMLSGFFDKLLKGLPKLEAAFATAAEKINEFGKKLRDAFTFPGLEEKVRALGAGLAQAFNKLVSDIDWYTLGQAFGAGLNLALAFLVELIYGFHWIALGTALAQGLNGIVSEINWEDFGRLLFSGFKIALELLAGFLLGLDMAQLAEAAGNIVKGFFNAMTETVDSIDWGEIGNQISTALTSIDWKGIGHSVAQAMNAIVTAIQNLIAEFKWKEIAQKFTEGLNYFIHDIDWAKAGKTFSETFHGLLEFLKTAIDEFDWDGFIDAIAEFIDNVNWDQLALDVVTIINKIVKKIDVDKLSEAIKPILDGLKTAAINLNWEELGSKIGKLIADNLPDLFEIGVFLIAGLFRGILSIFGGIGQWIKEHIFDPFIKWIKNLFGIHSPSTVLAEIGVDLILGLLDGITETWTQIVEFFQKVFDDLKQWFSETWDNIKQKAEESWSAIRQKAEEIWTRIKEFFAETWQKIKDKATETWENIKTTLTEKWNAAKQKAEETWNKVREFFAETWNKIKDKATEKWEAIKTTLTEKWSAAKAKAEETWNKVRDYFAETWQKIRDKASEKWDGIKQKLTGVWDEMKLKATTTFDGMKQSVLDAWNALGDGIKGVCNSILGGVESWINGIIRGINSMLGALSSVASAVGGVLGFGPVNLSISEVRLPRLAQGAVIPPNREFLAVLGDQKNGTNIETPLSTMVEAFRQALGESGAGQRVVVLKIGEREAGRMIVDLYNTETARVGVSV